MTFLKNLALSLLSFLLFLSLSIFASAFMLDKTLLNPDFVISELNRLDISSLAGEFLSEQIPQEEPYLAEVIDETIADLEPWMKEEMSTAIYSGYDYLMGRTESLNLAISTEPVKDSLQENLREAFLASPPPELQGAPSYVKEQYFNELYQQLAGNIPPTVEFTESSLPPDVLAMLEQVRQALSYSQLVYKALIGLMVLCALGIFLISRNVKHTTRSIGTPILVSGIIGYASIFALGYFNVVEQMMGMTGDIPAWLQTWMTQFMDNLMAPMKTFSLALLITGVVLIVISIVYRRRQPQPE